MRVLRRRILQVVVRRVQARARGDEPGVAAPRPAHGRVEKVAVGIDQRGLAEAYEFAVPVEFKPLPVHRGQHRDNLRLAKVRRRDRIVRVLQRLEGLDAREHRERTLRVGKSALAWQVRLRRDRQPIGKVREISVVGDLLQVEVAGEPRQKAEVLVVLPGKPVTRGVGGAVGQYFDVGLARDIGKQIAELAVDLQAAARHVARRQRRIVVWREVQIVRQRHFEATGRGRPEHRREEPRLALVRQWKAEPRRI